MEYESESMRELIENTEMFFELENVLCYIPNVLTGAKYWNCCQTLDVYWLFAIWMGQIQSKLIYIFVTYERDTKLVSTLDNFDFSLFKIK